MTDHLADQKPLRVVSAFLTVWRDTKSSVLNAPVAVLGAKDHYGSVRYTLFLFRGTCSGAWHWPGPGCQSHQLLVSAAHLRLRCYFPRKNRKEMQK